MTTDSDQHADPIAAMSAIVETYVGLLTNGTPEQIADLYADDATVEDPVGAEVRSTRDERVEFYKVITDMEERTATLTWKKVAGDTAVFQFTLVTKTGGMAFEISPVDIMVFDETGKIASMRAVWQPTDIKQV